MSLCLLPLVAVAAPWHGNPAYANEATPSAFPTATGTLTVRSDINDDTVLSSNRAGASQDKRNKFCLAKYRTETLPEYLADANDENHAQFVGYLANLGGAPRNRELEGATPAAQKSDTGQGNRGQGFDQETKAPSNPLENVRSSTKQELSHQLINSHFRPIHDALTSDVREPSRQSGEITTPQQQAGIRYEKVTPQGHEKLKLERRGGPEIPESHERQTHEYHGRESNPRKRKVNLTEKMRENKDESQRRNDQERTKEHSDAQMPQDRECTQKPIDKVCKKRLRG